MGNYRWSLIATVFRKWKTRPIQGYAPIKAVTYTVSLVVSKKLCRIHTLLLHTSNRKYHMAYLFVPAPMTLGDLEGHWPVAGLIKCNSTNICATFRTVQLTRRVARSLGDSWVLVLNTNTWQLHACRLTWTGESAVDVVVNFSWGTADVTAASPRTV